MDRSSVLALFDGEMRGSPPADPDETVERSGTLVRVIGKRGWVAFSRLTDSEAESAADQEAALFRRRGLAVEWKVYGHDTPRRLGEILAARGFVPDPAETLMALDLGEPRGHGSTGSDVVIERVHDRAGLEAAVRVSATAFAPEPGWTLEDLLPRLGAPTFEVFLATVKGRPASAGRLELPAGRSFASLWGGGTAPEFRGVGVYRALVEVRAELARRRGYRYLTVDALPTSRPILERIGFQPLTTIVGWVLTP